MGMQKNLLKGDYFLWLQLADQELKLLEIPKTGLSRENFPKEGGILWVVPERYIFMDIPPRKYSLEKYPSPELPWIIHRRDYTTYLAGNPRRILWCR